MVWNGKKQYMMHLKSNVKGNVIETASYQVYFSILICWYKVFYLLHCVIVLCIFCTVEILVSLIFIIEKF